MSANSPVRLAAILCVCRLCGDFIDVDFKGGRIRWAHGDCPSRLTKKDVAGLRAQFAVEAI